ncbi:hypothetical protein THIX_10454 [Thiomonas sp. X19]|nr:hypothetical protein THIX_10454 [Thiomonas sp. X19]
MAVSCSGARTAAIGMSSGEAFYRGEIAEALARHSAAYGGAMSRDALGGSHSRTAATLFRCSPDPMWSHRAGARSTPSSPVL